MIVEVMQLWEIILNGKIFCLIVYFLIVVVLTTILKRLKAREYRSYE